MLKSNFRKISLILISYNIQTSLIKIISWQHVHKNIECWVYGTSILAFFVWIYNVKLWFKQKIALLHQFIVVLRYHVIELLGWYNVFNVKLHGTGKTYASIIINNVLSFLYCTYKKLPFSTFDYYSPSHVDFTWNPKHEMQDNHNCTKRGKKSGAFVNYVLYVVITLK